MDPCVSVCVCVIRDCCDTCLTNNNGGLERKKERCVCVGVRACMCAFVRACLQTRRLEAKGEGKQGGREGVMEKGERRRGERREGEGRKGEERMSEGETVW